MLRPHHILWLTLACSSDPTSIAPPSDALSGDYTFDLDGQANRRFLPFGDHPWADSSAWFVSAGNHRVEGAIVRYRATVGGILPKQDTTGSDGKTIYRWGVMQDQMRSGVTEYVYGCVLVGTECTEQQLTNETFTLP